MGVGIPCFHLRVSTYGIGVLSKNDLECLVIGVLGAECETSETFKLTTLTTYLKLSIIAKQKEINVDDSL